MRKTTTEASLRRGEEFTTLYLSTSSSFDRRLSRTASWAMQMHRRCRHVAGLGGHTHHRRQQFARVLHAEVYRAMMMLLLLLQQREKHQQE